jgi:hypothetical protein
VKTKTHESKRKKRWYVREEMIKNWGKLQQNPQGLCETGGSLCTAPLSNLVNGELKSAISPL